MIKMAVFSQLYEIFMCETSSVLIYADANFGANYHSRPLFE